MISHHPTEAAEPTAAERLRYIDITFDSLRKAERDMIAAGLISPVKCDPRKGPTPRSIAIAIQGARIAAETIYAEGINPAVMVSQRHKDAYADLIACPPARLAPVRVLGRAGA